MYYLQLEIIGVHKEKVLFGWANPNYLGRKDPIRSEPSIFFSLQHSNSRWKV